MAINALKANIGGDEYEVVAVTMREITSGHTLMRDDEQRVVFVLPSI